MPSSHRQDRPATFSEAREEWLNKRTGSSPVSAIEGCLRHASLTAWNEPKTGRLVFIVETVSQWPRIEDVIAETLYCQETGPFSSLEVFNAAAVRFRNVVHQRYGPLV